MADKSFYSNKANCKCVEMCAITFYVFCSTQTTQKGIFLR